MAKVSRRRRRVNDFYETPPWMTNALINLLATSDAPESFQWTGWALEPCAGDGAISHILEGSGLRVWTNDIDLTRPADYHLNAQDDALYQLYLGDHHDHAPDWIITNPPFSQAHQILRRALEYVGPRGGVALLLRISFNEPTVSWGWQLEANPPDLVYNLPRWSFDRTGKQDSNHCAWFVWYGPDAPAHLPRGNRYFVTRQPKEQRRLALEEEPMPEQKPLSLVQRQPADETSI